MNFFQYKNNKLYAEDIPVQQLAEQFGTPLYVYSRAHLNVIGTLLTLLSVSTLT